MKKIYLSGPMTGLKNMNKAAFLEAEGILIRKGHSVVNPVILGYQLEASGRLNEMSEEEKYQAYLNYDLSYVPQCDAIYLLRGWETSRGALDEFTLAKMCKLELLFEGRA